MSRPAQSPPHQPGPKSPRPPGPCPLPALRADAQNHLLSDRVLDHTFGPHLSPSTAPTLLDPPPPGSLGSREVGPPDRAQRRRVSEVPCRSSTRQPPRRCVSRSVESTRTPRVLSLSLHADAGATSRTLRSGVHNEPRPGRRPAARGASSGRRTTGLEHRRGVRRPWHLGGQGLPARAGPDACGCPRRPTGLNRHLEARPPGTQRSASS